MQNRTRLALLAMAALVFFISSNAYAGLFDNVKKSTGLEADEKVELSLKEICPSLSEFDGTRYDVFKDEKYSYMKIHVAQVDDFNLQLAKLRGGLQAVTKISDETTTDVNGGDYEMEAVTQRIAKMKDVLNRLKAEAPLLIASGQNLVTSLPSILSGPKAAKIDSITKSIKAAIEEATAIPEQVNKLGESFKTLLATLAENAKKMAEKAADEAAAKAEGAVDAAKTAAEGAAGEAAAAAEDAANTAKDAAAEAEAAAGEAVDTAKEAAAGAGKTAGEAADAAKEGAEAAGEAAEKAGDAVK